MEMTALVGIVMVLAFGVYLVERLSYSKRVKAEVGVEMEKLRQQVGGELETVIRQLDSQRERLNKIELRR